MSRIDGRYDAVLHLLDRQVVDSDGLLVGKVDDLAVTADLQVTHLLFGRAALAPRLGGGLGGRLAGYLDHRAPQYADRLTPYVVSMERVADVGSGVTLDRPRLDLLVKRPVEHRVGDLLQLPVRTESGRELGSLLDVRLTPDGAVSGLIVGRGRPGSLLGYDRRQHQGPWLVAHVIRWLHRHSGYVDRRDLTRVDWGRQIVVATETLGELVDVDE